MVTLNSKSKDSRTTLVVFFIQFLFNLTKHKNLRHELFCPSVQLNNLTNFKNKGEENNLYILF